VGSIYQHVGSAYQHVGSISSVLMTTTINDFQNKWCFLKPDFYRKMMKMNSAKIICIETQHIADNRTENVN
jgi:hypothetical protein